MPRAKDALDHDQDDGRTLGDTPGTLAEEVDLDTVEHLVDQHRAAGLEPGLAYGLIRDGRLVHGGGRGVHRPGGEVPGVGTVFRIASMTKSFTAATVLLLRDEGRLRLDDEVARYVPEIAALRPPTDDAPPPTLRSLLTMTAGFPTDDPWGDRQQDLPDDDFARLLSGGLSLAWTPGVSFEYSNLGYALLGRVITAAAGEPYADVVTRRLLEPLGMASTRFTVEDYPAAVEDPAGGPGLAVGHRRGPQGWEAVPYAGYGAFAPMGGLFSTVADLARWIAGLAGAFPPRDGDPSGGPAGTPGHPLTRASRREMQLAHLGLPPVVAWRSVAEPLAVRGLAYGFGLVVERDARLGTLISHSGGYPGFGSHMRWHPASGLGVVVLGNATYTPVPRLGSQVMDALLTTRRRTIDLLAATEPATGSMRRATAAARADVDRLISVWDDDLAARLLAMNVALDEPLEERRLSVATLQDQIGPLEPDPGAAVTSVSPAHCAWWLRGPGGRVRVEIRLSPEPSPRVQTLSLTAVPDPSLRHRHAAAAVAAVLADDDPRWPPSLRLAPALDPAAATRQLRVAAAWSGPARVGDVVSSDGDQEVTFRLDGDRAALLLTLTADPVSGEVAGVTFTPAPPP